MMRMDMVNDEMAFEGVMTRSGNTPLSPPAPPRTGSQYSYISARTIHGS
jgi:hypothetical protein